MKFDRLFQPGRIGKMRLKNRIVMLPMGTRLVTAVGEVTDELIAHFARRAEGGAGLICVHPCYPTPTIDTMRVSSLGLRIDDDCFIPGLARLADAVHDAGAKVSIQLRAGGGSGASDINWTIGLQSIKEPDRVSCSPVPILGKSTPRELSVKEIKKIVQLFGMGARRIKIAGFDALEVTAHMRYLVAQFLSPFYNRRVDEYGGNVEGRLRFLLELIESARNNVGDDFPIILRFSVDERMEGGRGIKDSQIMAKRLQEVGVNAISADANNDGAEFFPKGWQVVYAEAMKEVVDIPVIAATKLGDPELAEEVLEEGRADFIGMGRALLADPDLPRKAWEGHTEDIRRCIYCNECSTREMRTIRCTINPVTGRETKYGVIGRAERSKHVMIAGAGPGGLEAARVAALRGHRVTLYEKTDELGGGQLKLAMAPPYKGDLKNIADYYSVQLNKLDNVKVELGKEVTADLVEKEKPDVLIVATGGRPIIPRIPGIDRQNVVSAWDVLAGKAEVGKTVVVAGGGTTGCETAHLLADQGKKVTIVEMLDAVALDAATGIGECLLEELANKNVTILTQRKIEEITNEGVIVTDKKKRNREIIKGDTIILALGTESLNTLEDELTGKVAELYVIGDAKEPRKMRDAISEGFVIARRV